MTTPALKLNPYAPPENNDLEQRLKQKLNDVFSFNVSVKNKKEITTYFNDKNRKS